jgi:hypothetical protein
MSFFTGVVLRELFVLKLNILEYLNRNNVKYCGYANVLIISGAELCFVTDTVVNLLMLQLTAGN